MRTEENLNIKNGKDNKNNGEAVDEWLACLSRLQGEAGLSTVSAATTEII